MADRPTTCIRCAGPIGTIHSVGVPRRYCDTCRDAKEREDAAARYTRTRDRRRAFREAARAARIAATPPPETHRACLICQSTFALSTHGKHRLFCSTKCRDRSGSVQRQCSDCECWMEVPKGSKSKFCASCRKRRSAQPNVRKGNHGRNGSSAEQGMSPGKVALFLDLAREAELATPWEREELRQRMEQMRTRRAQ